MRCHEHHSMLLCSVINFCRYNNRGNPRKTERNTNEEMFYNQSDKMNSKRIHGNTVSQMQINRSKSETVMQINLAASFTTP